MAKHPPLRLWAVTMVDTALFILVMLDIAGGRFNFITNRFTIMNSYPTQASKQSPAMPSPAAASLSFLAPSYSESSVLFLLTSNPLELELSFD